MKYVIFIFAILLFVGCEQPIVDSTTPIEDKKNLNTLIDPSNSNNPYDSSGYYHNLALDYIMQHNEEFGCDSATNVNALKTLLIDFETEVLQSIPSNLVEDSINNIFDEYFGYDIFLTPSQFQAKYNITGPVQNKLNQLINTAELITNSYTLEQVIDTIKNLESTWINDQYLTTNEKEILLRSSSILRYSFVYWNNVFNNPLHIWHGAFLDCNIINKHSDVLLALDELSTAQKLFGICISDAIGGAGGGILGAVTASAATSIYVFWDDIGDALSDAWDFVTGWF